MAGTTKNYQCRTQDGSLPSFGPAPASHFTADPEDNDSLVIGMGPIVPRWDVHREPFGRLQYFVREDTFPDAETAQFAATALQSAAVEWEKIGTGVTITSTNDQSSANFYLVYQASVGNSRTLAQAFFPNEVDQDVIVYGLAFSDEDNRAILKNIFLHELGHVYGLRHEFAITGDPSKGLRPEGEGAIQYMGKNKYSIMSYEFPPELQDSDKTSTKAFYGLPNGFKFGTRPVTDFSPQIRSTD